MVKKLDTSDRGVLEFRPNIHFVEPEVGPGTISPVQEVQLEDIPVQQVKQLAKAVDVLATAIQERVNEKAADVVIDVDPDVDAAVVYAMERHFPDANPLEVTYAQYLECKEEIIKMGEDIGKQAIIDPSEVAAVKDAALKANNNEPSFEAAQMGGFGTKAAKRGGLRPELQKRGQIIKPIDIRKLQVSLICILVNFIWKNFIVKAFSPIRVPGLGSVADHLPSKLCNPGAKIKIPDLFILGDKVPAVLKGKNQPKIPKKAPEKKK